MEIKPETLADWMKFIRFHPDLAERFMDCFWESQLTSKSHLLYALEDYTDLGNTYIFGGWFGILAKLIEDSRVLQTRMIISIDKDPICDWVIKNTYSEPSKIIPFTHDMGTFENSKEHSPHTVINTSTEHVTQEVYDAWWDRIPEGTLYALQGNNFWDDPEHIRCAHSLEEFKKINHCVNVQTEFAFPCGGPNNSEFMRFMVVGVK
jgi:hypothetical protein